MARNPPPVQCERVATIAVLCNLNRATQYYVVGRIALASITLAVQFCCADHTVAVQSATVDRIYGELFNVTNPLKVLVESGKHERNLVGWKDEVRGRMTAPSC